MRLARLCLTGLALLPITTAVVCSAQPTADPRDGWDVLQPRGKVKNIDFTTTEGTWMSVDISPDGRWIIFDLLGHIYRVSAEGGEATCLTQDSGIAVNNQPRFSPDGKLIAFVSDRKGQENLWVMGADGSNPRPVFLDYNIRVVGPAWMPDGHHIVVRRADVFDRNNPGIWMYDIEKGNGTRLTPGGGDTMGPAWPSPSPDGRFVYFSMNRLAGDVLNGDAQIRRVDLNDHSVLNVTANAPTNHGTNVGAFAPEISPDGRWLAFARRIPNATVTFKGHRMGPRTALWLRDLETGSERVLMDPITLDSLEALKAMTHLPGYSWARDGKSLVISQGGKIRRVDVATGRVATIPFVAHVQRRISERAGTPFRLPNQTLRAQMLRWHTASRDGKRLAFQAVGKVYVMDLPGGQPQRLTPAGFDPFEFMPAWSPDGKWVAFTTVDDENQGHLWKMRVGDPAPQRLTVDPGEYFNPVWSPDGTYIVFTRGAGASQSARRALTGNTWYDLVRVEASGGSLTKIVTVKGQTDYYVQRSIPRAAFGPDGRIFYAEKGTELASNMPFPTVSKLRSVAVDGSDAREHGVFTHADEVVPSPDGRLVAFVEGDNVYVAQLPKWSAGEAPVKIDREGKSVVAKVTSQGGLFPRWRDNQVLECGAGDHYFTYDAASKEVKPTEIKLFVPRQYGHGTVRLAGAKIVTIDKSGVIPAGDVVIKDGRIVCVGSCRAWQRAQTIDVRGKTIIPGLIDAHAHNHGEYSGIIPKRDPLAAAYFAYGVTTSFDPACWAQNVFTEAELIEAGMVVGPRTFSTGDFLNGFFGETARTNVIASLEDADNEVARLASYGAISVKQYLQPTRQQRQWIVESARRRGLRAVPEGGDLNFDLGLIMDGHSSIEHAPSHLPFYSDVTRFFGMAGTVYSPTVQAIGNGPRNDEYFLQKYDVWRNKKLQEFLPWTQLAPTRHRTLRPETDYSFSVLAQGVADVVKYGGYGVIGSHGQQHGIGPHWDVWAYASAMDPVAALRAATLHGAVALGLADDLGSITVGKIADLLVLNADPLRDIHNTADLRFVMKAGVLYDASSLDEVWPTSRKFGKKYWIDRDALRDDDRPDNYWDSQPPH